MKEVVARLILLGLLFTELIVGTINVWLRSPWCLLDIGEVLAISVALYCVNADY